MSAITSIAVLSPPFHDEARCQTASTEANRDKNEKCKTQTTLGCFLPVTNNSDRRRLGRNVLNMLSYYQCFVPFPFLNHICLAYRLIRILLRFTGYYRGCTWLYDFEDSTTRVHVPIHNFTAWHDHPLTKFYKWNDYNLAELYEDLSLILTCSS